MINTEHNANEVCINGTCTHDKQLPTTLKKTALRDVQNENAGLMTKQQDNFLAGVGKPNRDAVKVSGTKRLTPERPSSSQGLPSLTYNGMNENVMNARRRFELELGRGRLQKNVEIYSDSSQLRNTAQPSQEVPPKPAQMKDNSLKHMPVATSNNMTPITAFSSSVPSVPNKQNNSTQAVKVSPEIPRTVDIKSTNDQLRTERFIQLQKFLKQCDETNQRECMQMLLHLSPAELSKHAVELEKRAIQLTMEEDVREDGSAGATEPAGFSSGVFRIFLLHTRSVSGALVFNVQEPEMLAGNTTREVESDTVAEQELKTVKRDFGGLNEGIWPKSSLGHQTKFHELCSLDRSGGSSTGLMRKYASWFRCARRWISWSN
ncbi:hypothetical protein F511_26614 [Dorcoceras hygrometricum]|uniref:Uncharacterized protein n=1 Tax=Dorcoceras hygrometricum TaxID=472368 RepID=A0A2Z7DFF5_9LAMI|nr:hypothetical protein F511_26614 [Dorcoceras hygrometricum]